MFNENNDKISSKIYYLYENVIKLTKQIKSIYELKNFLIDSNIKSPNYFVFNDEQNKKLEFMFNKSKSLKELNINDKFLEEFKKKSNILKMKKKNSNISRNKTPQKLYSVLEEEKFSNERNNSWDTGFIE